MPSPNKEQPAIIGRRLRAVLSLRKIDLEELARRAEISSRHLQYQLSGSRTLTERTSRIIQDAVGKDGWDFAMGKRSDMKDPL
jgi:transcriptional regulator with XRE-family HTH domain